MMQHSTYPVNSLRPLVEGLTCVLVQGLTELAVLCAGLFSRPNLGQEVGTVQNLKKSRKYFSDSIFKKARSYRLRPKSWVRQ